MAKRNSAIAALAFLAGAVIRCAHLFLFDFVHEPFRLGGLFLAFAEEILKNGFRLPAVIPYYSSGGIPFAYPPLGFYLEAVALDLFPSWGIAIANLLPPLVSILALAAAGRFFHRWAGGWNQRSLIALTAYALLPNAFFNQIEAAGLAEAFGSLALILFFDLALAYRLKRDLRTSLLAGLGLSLCVVSSPGSALGGTLVSLLLAAETAFLYRWREGILPYRSLLTAALTAVIASAPYWLTVVLRHGLNVFFLPVSLQYELTGEAAASGPLHSLWFTYSALQQEGVYFWSLAGLLGAFWLLRQRDWFLPLAFAVLFSVPRENAWLTAFPLSLLAAHGIADVFLPSLQTPRLQRLLIRTGILWAAAGVVLLSLFLQAFGLIRVQLESANWKLTKAAILSLEQAQSAIPLGEPVIVLGNEGMREWAPYLLKREVINTEFGLEWKPQLYPLVMNANRAFAAAAGWQNVAEAVTPLYGAGEIYVVAEANFFPPAFEQTDAALFVVKMKTPELQIGVLDIP